MARTPLMAGNWKMNLNHVEAVGLVQKLAWTLDDKKHDPKKSEVVVMPPFTDLRTVQTLIEGDRLALAYGAQDVSPFDNGAYTGDVSASMLAKLGCQYVLVGHSERREYYGEDDNLVNAKAKMAVSKGLTPIVCVGEGLEVREELSQVAFTIAHVEGALAGLSAGADRLTGDRVRAGLGHRHRRVATPEDAQEVCGAIRGWVGQWYDTGSAEDIRILYGGSVKASNVASIMAAARHGRLPGRRGEPGGRGVLCYSTVLRPARALISGYRFRRLCELGYVRDFVPLMTTPILIFSIVLVITSVALALFVLMHKGRGGGLSDLFGGGISSSMGGASVAERNLDRLTIIIGVVWLASIVALGLLYKLSA